jgi:hypothetical protein
VLSPASIWRERSSPATGTALAGTSCFPSGSAGSPPLVVQFFPTHDARFDLALARHFTGRMATEDRCAQLKRDANER